MSEPDLETDSAPGGETPIPADDAAHLLIVDDDRRIRILLQRYLSQEGYRVTLAGNAEEAEAALKNFSFDLLVLDVMMPGENGLEFAARLRADSSERGRVPILMLTAKAETDDRIAGFEKGVDDFLPKPFEPRELSLRIASILRRAQPAEPPTQITHVHFGGFVFDLQRGDLRRGEEIVRLTERERDMLRLLAARPGETVARDVLAGPGGAGNERTVDVQVNRLRHKIERDPANPLHLQTVRGAGYRLLIDRL
jgi:two-component system, OmpR family, phosphate regulon response regulator OmpR